MSKNEKVLVTVLTTTVIPIDLTSPNFSFCKNIVTAGNVLYQLNVSWYLILKNDVHRKTFTGSKKGKIWTPPTSSRDAGFGTYRGSFGRITRVI